MVSLMGKKLKNKTNEEIYQNIYTVIDTEEKNRCLPEGIGVGRRKK